MATIETSARGEQEFEFLRIFRILDDDDRRGLVLLMRAMLADCDDRRSLHEPVGAYCAHGSG